MLTCDFNYLSKNKAGEEICGDSLKILKDEIKACATVSDGLGSGVKANILSTLTSTIATTMVFNDVSLEEVLRSIISTLPICKVRRISYANFCIFNYKTANNDCTIIEYEFPIVLYYRQGKLMDLKKERVEIFGKEIFVSKMQPEKGDTIFLMTDGVSLAGMGTKQFPLGFGSVIIAKEISNMLKSEIKPQEIVKYVINKVIKLDEGTTGDDAMVLSISFREPRILNVMVGPPSKPELDEFVVNKFINSPGRRVVCGGTTGNIISRVLKKPIKVDLASATENSPPVAFMENVDMITEGILTLTQIYRFYEGQQDELSEAQKLFLKFIEESDTVNFFVGRALNPTHQNPLFSHDISLKFRLIKDLSQILKEKRKIVKTEYF